jgi:hypothetical protein
MQLLAWGGAILESIAAHRLGMMRRPSAEDARPASSDFAARPWSGEPCLVKQTDEGLDRSVRKALFV